jgi:hypothetical protein
VVSTSRHWPAGGDGFNIGMVLSASRPGCPVLLISNRTRQMSFWQMSGTLSLTTTGVTDADNVVPLSVSTVAAMDLDAIGIPKVCTNCSRNHVPDSCDAVARAEKKTASFAGDKSSGDTIVYCSGGASVVTTCINAEDDVCTAQSMQAKIYFRRTHALSTRTSPSK